jgi:hypothetical protein
LDTKVRLSVVGANDSKLASTIALILVAGSRLRQARVLFAAQPASLARVVQLELPVLGAEA